MFSQHFILIQGRLPKLYTLIVPSVLSFMTVFNVLKSYIFICEVLFFFNVFFSYSGSALKARAISVTRQEPYLLQLVHNIEGQYYLLTR